MSRSAHRLDDMDVVANFTEALQQRVGTERFQMWFGSQVRFEHTPKSTRDGHGVISVIVGGQFALDRLKKNYMSEMRGAAAGVDIGMRVELRCEPVAGRQTELPLDDEAGSPESPTHESRDAADPDSSRPADPRPLPRRSSTSSHSRRSARSRSGRSGHVRSIQHLADQAVLGQTRTGSSRLDPRHQTQPQTSVPQSIPRDSARSHSRPPAQGGPDAGNPGVGNSGSGTPSSGSLRAGPDTQQTMETFIPGACNTLAHTAAMMVCNDPGSGALVYLSGPSGVGKSHLLSATADHLRRRYRFRGVIQMSAEQFTNEFVAVVGKTGITDFRTRYRDVDALLIDDVHFFAKKKATIRELIHTIGEIQRSGKLIVFAGNASPHDVDGFTGELAGRLSSGLVCSMATLDSETRKRLLLRWISTRCALAIDEKTVDQINDAMVGDGRAISGVVNVINLMQRMNHRTPTFSEIRQNCGHLLRGAGGEITLSTIEVAVADAFGLEDGALRSGSQTRRVAQPRMLAMYLSRQKTSSAYTEIAKHFNVKSHSTAMAAEKNVGTWLDKESLIGRGAAAVPAAEAIARVERLLTG